MMAGLLREECGTSAVKSAHLGVAKETSRRESLIYRAIGTNEKLLRSADKFLCHALLLYCQPTDKSPSTFPAEFRLRLMSGQLVVTVHELVVTVHEMRRKTEEDKEDHSLRRQLHQEQTRMAQEIIL